MTSYEGSSLTEIEAVLDGLDEATSLEVFDATRGYAPRAIASVAASRADAAGGGGATGLADPGNVWEPDTAVTEGYRIKHTYADDDHIFEAAEAGTTADWAASFDELDPKYGPGSVTTGDNFGWVHIGIVGRLPDSVLPGLRPAVRVDDDSITSVVSTKAPEDSARVFTIDAIVDGDLVPVFDAKTDGDADWNLDQNTGAGFRFSQTIDGVGVTGAGQVQITTDGFKVSVGLTDLFEVRYDPFVIDMVGLPTADPGVAGRLWNSAGTLKISAG